MAGLTKEQRAAKAQANADQTGTSQITSSETQDSQGSSTDTTVTGNDDNQGADSTLTVGADGNIPTADNIMVDKTQVTNQDGSIKEGENSIQPPASPQTPPTVIDVKEAENQFITQNPIKEMEEKVAEPQLFSELNYKTELVIKNTNGIEQVVTKRFWEQTREAELDRLQGLELLGIAKFTDREKGEYDILSIEDDWVPEKPEKK